MKYYLLVFADCVKTMKKVNILQQKLLSSKEFPDEGLLMLLLVIKGPVENSINVWLMSSGGWGVPLSK